MTKKPLPMIIFLGFLWGSTMVASRFSLGQFGTSTFIALRLSLGAVLFLLLYPTLFKRKLPTDRELIKRGIFLGIFGTALPMNLFVHALNYQSSGITAVLSALSPALVALLAHFFVPEEKSSRQQAVGIAISFSGAVLLIALGENGLAGETTSTLGFTLVLIAVALGAVVDVYTRLRMTECDAKDITLVRTATAMIVMLPLAFLLEGFDISAVEPASWLTMLYATIAGTVMAFLFSLYNIQKFGVTTASTVTYIIPIFATLGGWLLLDEIITTGMLGGMSLIAAGIYILNRKTAVIAPQIGD